MQTVITIDGRKVPFKASASIAHRYKAHFNKDLLDIAMPLISSVYAGMQEGELDLELLFEKASYNLELVDLYNLIWVMAKTADDSIPEPIAWFDSFEEFPGIDIAKELWKILLPSMLTTEESKKNLMKKAKKAPVTRLPQQPSSQPQKPEVSDSENSSPSPGDN